MSPTSPTSLARSVRPDPSCVTARADPSDASAGAPSPGPSSPASGVPSRRGTRLLGSLTLAAGLAMLSACGGGGAGDGGEDFVNAPPTGPNPIDAFVGVYDLTGNWDGQDGDVASLVIRERGDDGRADVLLYDLDDLNGGDNCYVRPGSGGFVELDVTGERVFMNRVAPFDSAELSLSGTTLVIDYIGVDDAELTYQAPSVGITETDLTPPC